MKKEYSISEIAKIFKITTNKVRFYEKKGLLSPVRMIESDYRKYDEKDIIRLQSILLYRSIGLSIDNIKNILDNNDKENYITHFNNQWELVNNEIHRLSEIRKSLECIIDNIYEEDDTYKIEKDLLNVINKSNNLNDIKFNWNDKWDFNNWASTYDEDVKVDKGELKIYKNYDYILEEVYNTVEKKNVKGSKILEIGVGTGNLANKFIKDYDIVGIDQSREMLAVAKQKYPKLKVRLGEFLKIPYENNSFDIIISTYAFHHLNTKEKSIAIEEMNRVLKDNGSIIIGDLMFKNEEDKNSIINNLSQCQIDEIEDEYYSYVNFLEDEFEKYGKSIDYNKVDDYIYIVNVK